MGADRVYRVADLVADLAAGRSTRRADDPAAMPAPTPPPGAASAAPPGAASAAPSGAASAAPPGRVRRAAWGRARRAAWGRVHLAASGRAAFRCAAGRCGAELRAAGDSAVMGHRPTHTTERRSDHAVRAENRLRRPAAAPPRRPAAHRPGPGDHRADPRFPQQAGLPALHLVLRLRLSGDHHPAGLVDPAGLNRDLSVAAAYPGGRHSSDSEEVSRHQRTRPAPPPPRTGCERSSPSRRSGGSGSSPRSRACAIG